MKVKDIKISVLFILLSINGFSQGPINFSTTQISNPNILPPEVSSFQKVNFLPVSNYTGRADVGIPFYSIEIGDVKIPIGLSYNTGGVKSNDVASSVGMNWSLNAGGMISKTVKGNDDFKHGIASTYDWEMQASECHGPFGWLSYGSNNQIACANINQNGFDTLPDIFNASAPGLNLSFIHNKSDTQVGSYLLPFSYGNAEVYGINQNGQTINNIVDSSPMDGAPFILDGDNSYSIQETYGNITLGCWGIESGWQNAPNQYMYQWWDANNGSFNANYSVYGINSISITNTNGVKYIFDKIDSSQYVYDRNASLSDNTTLATNINLVSYRLSKIIDLKTNQFVEFQYETYSLAFSEIIDNFEKLNYEVNYPLTPENVKGLWQKYPKLNRIKKIIFEQGYIDFAYNQDRLDVTGEKALTSMTLFDKKNTQIKKAILNFDYFQSPVQQTSPYSKRLKLNEVHILGNNTTVVEKYKLTYNQTSLPLRIMAVTDLFGYHNGEANNFQYYIENNEYIPTPPLTEADPIPTCTFNPNSGQYSFFNDALAANGILILGNYSQQSNFTYCKAGVLERIDFPTGGYISLNYELNKFKVNNEEFEGGGLRVKEQIISDGTNVRTLKFEYKNEDNTSSGTIVSVPKFVEFDYVGPKVSSLPNNVTQAQFDDWFYYKKFNYSKSNIEVTQGAYIGYSRVKVFEEGKGYKLYEYTSPNLHPNQMSDMILSDAPAGWDDSCQNTNNYKRIYYDNGKSDLFFDNDVFRGRLIKEKTYNQQDILLKESISNYTEKKFKSLLVVKPFNQSLYNEDYCDTTLFYGPGGKSFQFGFIDQRRYLLTSVQDKEYFNGSEITHNKSYVYDNNYSVVKTELLYDSQNTYKTENTYAFDAVNQSEFGMTNLISSNRISEPIQTKVYKNNELLIEEKNLYNTFIGLTLLKLNKKHKTSSIGNTDEVVSSEVTLRDDVGNICEITELSGKKVSFIWGYNKTEVVAVIENKNYSGIPVNLITAIHSATDSPTGTEAQVLTALTNLRNNAALVNTMPTTYTHKPLIGVSTITDFKGDKVTYSYDSFGRLQFVKDKSGNILSENEYHYKPQN